MGFLSDRNTVMVALAVIAGVTIYNVAELFVPRSVAQICASHTQVTPFCKGVIERIEMNEFIKR